MKKAVIFDMFETLVTDYRSPLYFSKEMAADIGVEVEAFRKTWHAADEARTRGDMTLGELVEKILRENGCYTDALRDKVVKKRGEIKKMSFERFHRDIVPMLAAIKQKGLKIGIVSNCFSEEIDAIHHCPAAPYVDALILSYEVHLQKPDPAIFQACLSKLGVKAEECLFVGDGGSNELEATDKLGMRPLQAGWYLAETGTLEAKRQANFPLLQTPFDVLDYLD